MGGITTTLFQRPRDPFFNQTTLLLSGNFPTNGAQNNTFLDSSSNNFSITRNPSTGPNAPTQGTFSPFSQTGWSNYFDGSSRLDFPTTATYQIGSSDFTYETWVYVTASGFNPTIYWNANSSGYAALAVRINSATGNPVRLSFSTSGSSWVTDTDYGTTNLNTWNHIAVVRSGNNIKLYLNGIDITSGGVAVSGSLMTTYTLNQLASYNSTSYRLTGYLSNTRLVIGTALYTSNFTPSTAPLTTTSQGATAAQTKILTCQSNRFVDNSDNGAAITVNGTPSVQAFSPFVPSGAYTTTAVGGSGYFDGTGDYLVTSGAALDTGAGTSDVTFECWVYNNGFSGSQYGRGIFTFYPSASYATNRLMVRLDSASNKINMYLLVGSAVQFGGSGTNSTALATPSAWTHIALVRSSQTFRLYINGALDTTLPATTASLNTFDKFDIGRNQDGTVPDFNGYISGFRYLKGTAQYTAAFTPPTAPPTAIANTQLLLNFTNAGITDATSKNDLETVGNAQISTTQSKFGGTSMSFDGTNSVAATRGNSNITQFGTGDFTVEMWLYPTAFATYKSVWCCSTSAANATGFHIGFNASGQMFLYSAGGFQISSSANSGVLTINTWNHVAVQRNGSTVRIFVNGVAATSTWTLTTQSFTDGACLFGATPAGNSEYYAGFIDDARITRGVARYSTTGFNVPTIGFTDR